MQKSGQYLNPQTNDGVNIGHSSRLSYDKNAYEDKLAESVSPLSYRMNPISIYNVNACNSTFGPRTTAHGSQMGSRISMAVPPNVIAPAQQLVDIDSILSNRNVLQSKCKDAKVNDINVTQFRLQHARVCNNFLDPVSSRITNPSINYRSIPINRFYNLRKNPQVNIFYDFAVNSKLEAKDNYRVNIPNMREELALPKEYYE